MRSVPYEFVSGLASEFGAVECCWRESERSFTGYVAECWFGRLPSVFALKWAAVVGYQVRVRCVSSGPSKFVVSIPVTVPQGSIRLSGGQRGGQAQVVVHYPSAY
ncbi:MAG: hypothetical protein ACFB2W_22610 [Leptolyngbyaceae cyanobacterium]